MSSELDGSGWPIVEEEQCKKCGKTWSGYLPWIRCRYCNHTPYWADPIQPMKWLEDHLWE